MQQKNRRMIALKLAYVHVNSHGKKKNGNEAEVDDGVDEYGHAAGLEVAELDHSAIARELEDEPRRQKDEQDDGNEHRPPVRHL